MNALDSLVEIGFGRVGTWRQAASGGINLDLTRLQKAKPALYAFVVDNDVKYVGKTSQSLASRLYGYQKPAPTQSTNIKVNGQIAECLLMGLEVEVFALENALNQMMGRFQVNLAAGLEDDIIRQLNPAWNGRIPGKSLPLKPEKLLSAATVKQDRKRPTDNSSSTKLPPSFLVTVGKTYHRMGFFNVPVDYDRYFAGHNKDIQIKLPKMELTATVNRTANNTGAPRIMGGVKLRDWFKDSLTLDDRIKVIIVSKGIIEIIKA